MTTRVMCRLGLAAAAVAAVLAVVPAGAGAAAGGPTSCSANVSVPPVLRAEGQTELVGDIVLGCTGGPPTGMGIEVPKFTLTVFLNTATTSPLLAAPWDDPLLLIDEPGSGLTDAPTTQLACQAPDGKCSLTGNDTGKGQYDGSPGHPNVFQGQVANGRVTFADVPIDSLGPSTSRFLRIVNLRGDASGINLGGGSLASATAVLAFDGNSPTITGSTPTVGFVARSMTVSTRTPDASAPLAAPTDVAACTTQKVGALRFAETFGTTFKKRTAGNDPAAPASQSVPGLIINSETGLFNPALVGNAARGNLGVAGLAAFGTRLKSVFDHVPAGASLFVPTSVTTGDTALQLVPSESGPFAAVPPSAGGPAGTAPVAIAGGTGTAVWEVVGTSANRIETVDVPVYAASGSVAGAVSVSGGFAPSGGTTVPRFTAPAAGGGLAKLSACSRGPTVQPGAKPAMSAVTLTNKRFRVGSGDTAISAARAPVGTTFRFTLAAPAKLTIAITRRTAGLRKGKKCVAPTGKLRRAHAKRCTRTITAGTLTRANVPAGAGGVVFTGRIGHRPLKPHSYKAVLTASNSAGRSNPAGLSFAIVR